MQNKNQFIKDFDNYIDKFLNLRGKDWIEVLKEKVIKPNEEDTEWFLELYKLQNLYGYDTDIFGTYLEEKNQTNTSLGQFFTPMPIAKLMSEINFPENIQELLDGKYLSVSDPCSGTGRFMIAHADVALSKFKQFWTPTTFYYINTDLDHKAYVFSALNAVLRNLYSINIYGNTITLEVYGAIITAPNTSGLSQWSSNIDLEKIKNILQEPLERNLKEEKQEESNKVKLTLF